MEQIVTNNFEATQQIGQEFAKRLIGGDIVCLYGDLGAGKTTFMQGLAKGLAIHQRIISPTFIIVRKYEVPVSPVIASVAKQSYINEEIASSPSLLRVRDSRNDEESAPIRFLYHIDLYRTETKADLETLGLPEVLQEKDAIIAIEWSEKLGGLLPMKRWDIKLEWVSEEERRISISHLSDLGNL